jgi:aspartyl-tRNA(Asn)/glutamyl-tRNA(Gln) amidotransferase subunit A
MTDSSLSTDIATLTAAELAPMIRAKVVSPVELMQAVLERIERLEPEINAFAYLDGDRAMAGAREAEAALMRDGPIGPLHGLPVTIKDLAAVAGMPTRSGSRTSGAEAVPADSPFVERLRAAGAIPIGKTTTSEFGWSGVSRSPLTGITHNPWRHGFNAGASSAGAGAAAAAGFGPLHQGSDGAGSIRMPAAFCGVFGLKPSFGRVPNAPLNVGDNTSHVGPMTRSVADAAMMLEMMAGPHHLDHTSLEAWPAAYGTRLHAGIAGRRVAFSPDLGHAQVDPEVATSVRAAAEAFSAAAGVTLHDVTPGWGPRGPALAREFWAAHLTRLEALLPAWEAEMDPGLVACIRAGGTTTMPDYQAMRVRKHAYIAEIHSFFQDWDFLITPSISVAAFPAEMLCPAHWPEHAWDWMRWAEFSYPFNMAWNPAASVPCGLTPDGLPVGLQIVGGRFDDLGVLQAAAAFEAALPWALMPPGLGMGVASR